MANGEIPITDTPLASFLVLQGFDLLEIRYSDNERLNKRQGTFYFQDAPELRQNVINYNRGEAMVNLALYERTRNNLLDRIMRGLP